MGGTIDKDYPRSTRGYAFEIDEPAAGRVLEVMILLSRALLCTSDCHWTPLCTVVATFWCHVRGPQRLPQGLDGLPSTPVRVPHPVPLHAHYVPARPSYRSPHALPSVTLTGDH